jgi:predicted kinase
MLIVLGGLPGVGKTTIARALAQKLPAVHIRIDSIEEAIRLSGVTVVSLDDAGYRVAYAIADDNLRLGLFVIADSVNPLPITRDAWLAVAQRAGTAAMQVEVRCSDVAEHRRRVERRVTEQGGPTWADVLARDYHVWHPELVIDTATTSVEEATTRVAAMVDNS